MIGKQISHYQIIEKLGGGGMGIVYKALDTKLDRFVALKFLPPYLGTDDDKKRFLQEARAASSLDHPNICTVHEINETEDGQLFIAMACYEGETLKEKIENSCAGANGRSPLQVEEAVEIAIQICHGLERAHQAGIIHRDIKPANIMITTRHEVKILDFGLAKLAGQSELTREGSTPGTVAYMSPEQTMGTPVNHRTDIWSLGVIMYEMLTGELPFKGDYDQAVIYSILKEEPQKMTSVRNEIPPQLQEIVDKSLVKNPDKRYQHVHEVLNDLQALGGIAKTSTFRSVLIRKRRILKRQGAFYAFVSALLFLSLFAYFFFIPSLTLDRNSKTIAVLPLENLGSDPENEYFSDGITDDIREQLSKVSELRVISRYSVMQYKSNPKNLQEIGEELGAGTILDGTIRRQKDRVRITVELVDVTTLEQLWAETFDKALSNVFQIQSDIAQKIALTLKAELTVHEKARIEKAETENLTAYEYYLKGREYYSRFNNQRNEQAIELFKKAIELDPKYAQAYAGLAEAYAARRYTFGHSRAWLDSAITMGEKALAIDSNSSEAYSALGHAYLWHWYIKDRFPKALKALNTALELNPSNRAALRYLAELKEYKGELEEALRLYKRARDLNPLNVSTYNRIANIYSKLGDSDAAEKWFANARELNPGRPQDYFYYLEQKNIDSAITNLKASIQLNPKAQWRHHDLALLYQTRGRSDSAIAELEKAIEIAPTQEYHYIALAGVYFEEGKPDEALTVYRHARENCVDNVTLDFNYSLLLSHVGRDRKAGIVTAKWAGNIQDYRKYYTPIIRYYMGLISEAEMKRGLRRYYREELITEAEATYYLGSAYLLNLRPDSTESQRDTAKAVVCLNDYLLRADKLAAELPMVRAQLKQLKQLKTHQDSKLSPHNFQNE